MYATFFSYVCVGVPVTVCVCECWICVSLVEWLLCGFFTSSLGAGEGIKILSGGGRRLGDFDIFVVVFFCKKPLLISDYMTVSQSTVSTVAHRTFSQ